MYVVLKDENPKMAKNGILLGLVLTVVNVIVVPLLSFRGLPAAMMRF